VTVPGPIADLVPSIFDSEGNPLYAQAATAGADGAPNVRTVHYRYVPDLETIAFACHTESPKWRELVENPRVCGCWFHPKRQIQLRWNAAAELVTDTESPEVERSWDRTHEWIRKEYWKDDARAIENVSPHFGVVVLRVDLWDLYEIDLEDPSKSRRRLWRLEGGAWHEEAKSTLL
jgi:general stress protein 26